CVAVPVGGCTPTDGGADAAYAEAAKRTPNIKPHTPAPRPNPFMTPVLLRAKGSPALRTSDLVVARASPRLTVKSGGFVPVVPLAISRRRGRSHAACIGDASDEGATWVYVPLGGCWSPSGGSRSAGTPRSDSCARSGRSVAASSRRKKEAKEFRKVKWFGD